MVGRAEYMLSIAASSLSDVSLADTDLPGFKRYIKREPLGVILVISPWNFPYLVAINSVLPAIIAGNAVLLKPSPQTPLVAERFQRAFEAAGLPSGVMRAVHLGPEGVERAVKHELVDFVSVTGSVAGGQAVEKMATEANGFKGVALEVTICTSLTLKLNTNTYLLIAWWEGSCVCSTRCRSRLHCGRTCRR